MKEQDKKQSIIKREYQRFLAEPDRVSPPPALSASILARVRSDLSPPPNRVLFKLLWIHIGAAVVTLSFCPQFGLGFFDRNHGVMSFAMRYGHWACEIGCGGIFLGLTALASAILMSREEAKVLYRRHLSFFSFLGLLSVISFMAIGYLDHVNTFTPHPQYLPIWLGSALLSSRLVLLVMNKGRVQVQS